MLHPPHSLQALIRRCSSQMLDPQSLGRTSCGDCGSFPTGARRFSNPAARGGDRLASIRIAPADLPSPLRLRAILLLAASSFIADPRPKEAVDENSLEVMSRHESAITDIKVSAILANLCSLLCHPVALYIPPDLRSTTTKATFATSSSFIASFLTIHLFSSSSAAVRPPCAAAK